MAKKTLAQVIVLQDFHLASLELQAILLEVLPLTVPIAVPFRLPPLVVSWFPLLVFHGWLLRGFPPRTSIHGMLF
jgi:hypothetical protein